VAPVEALCHTETLSNADAGAVALRRNYTFNRAAP